RLRAGEVRQPVATVFARSSTTKADEPPTARSMLKLVEYFQVNPLVCALGALVLVLLVHFLAQYLVRGLGLRWQLARLVEEVGAAGPAGSAELKARLAQL